MIPSKNRLPREAFRARGYRTDASPFFLIKTRDNGVGVNRIGVVVGLSVDKRATRRNFWERLAKANLLRMRNIKKDIIIILSPRIKTLTKRQFTEEIKKILQKQES